MPAVIMPKMGDAMEEGTVLKWLKAEGDTVAKDEAIAEIETDKATLELTAEYAGVLSKRIASEGESVAIGKPIAMITGEGETPEPAPEAKAQAAEPEPQPEAQSTAKAEQAPTEEPPTEDSGSPAASDEEEQPAPAKGERQPATTQVHESGGRIKVSPLARRIAQEHDIDLSKVPGSGPNGRIIREDIEAYLKQPQAAAATTSATPAPTTTRGTRDIPISRMRNAIARQMVLSKTTIPHFYVSLDVDMTEALKWRKQINEMAEAKGYKVTVNDMVVKACGLALTKFPNLNATFGGDKITYNDEINISIAVAMEGGLIAPVVRGVDKKSLGVLAQETNELVGRAREGKLAPAEYSGGTFTVSNLGPFNVDTFIAIVTPPQAAALAVASSIPKVVVVDGQMVIRDQMTISLSADHRLTDGAEGAQFVSEIRRVLENPLALLI